MRRKYDPVFDDIDACLPWVEKHRPRKLDYINVDSQIKNQVLEMIKKKDVPNIIFEGPPGVGKTSTIKCIARDIYGRYYKDMVLELNASDDRGIKIQENIENFRKPYVHINKEDIGKIPTFKMVILDEADNMTDKAKHIISGFIKDSASDLRFAFTCNSKDKIIPSIQSGCHIVKYPPLDDDAIIIRLREICVVEKIIVEGMSKKDLKDTEEGIRIVAQIANGDMRTALNILQVTYNRYDKITGDYVYSIQDKPHPEKSRDIIICCISGDLGGAIEKATALRLIGFSGTDIALGLRLALKLDICSDIDEDLKMNLWKCLCYSSYNISKGLESSLLQVSACIADMYVCCNKFNKFNNFNKFNKKS